MAMRSGIRSMPITGLAPMALAAAPVMIPIGPRPWTTTDLPRPTPSPAQGMPGAKARSSARVPQAIGSASAAILRLTPAGSLNSHVCGRR
jgi:hypothetical protein